MPTFLLKLAVTASFYFFASTLYAKELIELNMSKEEVTNLNEQIKVVKENELIKQPAWQYLGNTPMMARIIQEKKLPTVIVLHGSGGTEGHHHTWAERINKWGYHSVLVESFKQRGVSGIVETQSIKPQDRVSDVLSAAKWIKEQTWSDGQIAMIGYSHGGNTVFETALVSGNLFKGGVAYYPYCHGWFSGVKIPIQLHLAIEDDWNPATTCSFLYKGLFKLKEVITYEYPNSHHGFDHTRGYVTKFPAMTGGSLRTVTYGSNKEQAEISFSRVKEFLSKLFN
jgi:dienelactone hydrolase